MARLAPEEGFDPLSDGSTMERPEIWKAFRPAYEISNTCREYGIGHATIFRIKRGEGRSHMAVM